MPGVNQLDYEFSQPVTVPTGTGATVSALCPDGSLPVGGGASLSPSPVTASGDITYDSLPQLIEEDTPSGRVVKSGSWLVEVFNNSGPNDEAVTAIAICAETQSAHTHTQ